MGSRLPAADPACEPSPAQRAPDHRADPLVQAQRHQLPLVVTPDQRVVGLVGYVARPAVAPRRLQRLHQVPAREIGHAHVADLAGPHELVERRQGLLHGRHGVKAVQLEEVDVVRAEPPERSLDCGQQVLARGADVVGARPGPERALGRQDHLVPPPFDRLAQHRLGLAAAIDVGAVEHVESGVQADVEQPPRFGPVAAAPGRRRCGAAAEGQRAEAQHWHAEARSAQTPVFH